MPLTPQPYTETFLRQAHIVGAVAWTCPPGKRAVITSVVVTNPSSSGGTAQAFAAGVCIYHRVFQAAVGIDAVSMRVVVYHGATLQLYTGVESIQMTISGYLLDDTTEATSAPGDVRWGILPDEPVPDPADLEHPRVP